MANVADEHRDGDEGKTELSAPTATVQYLPPVSLIPPAALLWLWL